MAAKKSRENILERIRERRAASRKKLLRRAVKIGAALVVLVAVLAILYPFLQVVWHTRKARGNDPETRKAALQWLADNNVRSSIPIFVEALGYGRTESRIAFEALRKFKDTAVIPDLLKVWKDKTAKTYARYNALQLVAELGGREQEGIFLDPLAILSDGWESVYDFLNAHADEETVGKLLGMLESGDERRQRAAAVALRYLGKKSFVRDSDRVKDALAGKLRSPEVGVRQEAAYALCEMADEKQFEQLMAALDDESPAVCRYAAIGIGAMKPEVAVKAVPKMLEKLLAPDPDICREAAHTLIKIGSAEAIPRLVEIVKDPKIDSFSRENAIEVLKTTSDARALEAITGALSDPEKLVAKAAARALVRVGNKSSVEPLVSTLKSARSQSLRIVAAYALGMLAEKEAAPALISTLKEGDIELSRVAGAALLRTGAREYAPEIAGIIRNPDSPAVARREALLALSKFRTVSAVELTIEALTDEIMQIREEARDASVQLTDDLLAPKKPDLESARKVLEDAAGRMWQEEIGEKLRVALSKAGNFDEMNRLVHGAMRHLDEKNRPDLNTLEEVIEEAKGIYWASLLREEFTGRGMTENQIAQAAGALRDYIRKTYMPEEPPMEMHRKIGEELKRKFGFLKAPEDEPQRE